MIKYVAKWTAVVFCTLVTSAVLLPQQHKPMSMSGWTSEWDYDGKKILGHIESDVYLWDARTARMLHKFVGHRERIRSVQFSPDGKYALTDSAPNYANEGCRMPEFRSKDTSVRLWSLESGEEVWKIEGHLAGVFSPDGQRLLTLPLQDPLNGCGGGGIAGIAMWDVATRRQLFSVTPGSQMLAFGPGGRTFLAFKAFKDAVSVYDARDGSEIGRLEHVESGSFSGPNGDVATTPFLNSQLEVWDSRSKSRRRQVLTDRSAWVAWTPDGSRMIQLSGSCGSIRVWAADSGQMLSQPACDPNVELHSNYILASPDNRRLLLWVNGYIGEGSRAVLPTVELYDLNTGSKLAKIPKSGTPIGFSPDGQTFLVAGANEEKPLTHLLQLDSFRVYRADSGEPIVTLDLEHGLVR